MDGPDPQLAADLTAFFTDDTRLYAIEGDGGAFEGLWLERWYAREAISQVWATELSKS